MNGHIGKAHLMHKNKSSQFTAMQEKQGKRNTRIRDNRKLIRLLIYRQGGEWWSVVDRA